MILRSIEKWRSSVPFQNLISSLLLRYILGGEFVNPELSSVLSPAFSATSGTKNTGKLIRGPPVHQGPEKNTSNASITRGKKTKPTKHNKKHNKNRAG